MCIHPHGLFLDQNYSHFYQLDHDKMNVQQVDEILSYLK